MNRLFSIVLLAFVWDGSFSDEAVREWIRPDAVIEETVDDWRPCFVRLFSSVVEGKTNVVDAVQAINSVVWDKTGVKYSTERDKACQSPFHSMATHLASCTGMSIIQICAYRAVGIPARLVGCNWTTIPGNHSWVEFMDERGEWHFFGDGDPTPIDESWVAPFAAEADASKPEMRIYASRATPNAQETRFWRTWGEPFEFSDVWADDVTERYRKYRKAGTSEKDVPQGTNYTLPQK